MLRMIIHTRSKADKNIAAAHAAHVDDVADDELHDPDSANEGHD